jgi:hypothetical protein
MYIDHFAWPRLPKPGEHSSSSSRPEKSSGEVKKIPSRLDYTREGEWKSIAGKESMHTCRSPNWQMQPARLRLNWPGAQARTGIAAPVGEKRVWFLVAVRSNHGGEGGVLQAGDQL